MPITEEEYLKRRKAGESKEQIIASVSVFDPQNGSAKSGKLSEDDYIKLRNAGYSKNDIIGQLIGSNISSLTNDYNRTVDRYNQDSAGGWRSRQNTAAYLQDTSASSAAIRNRTDRVRRLMEMYDTDDDYRKSVEEFLKGTESGTQGISDYAKNSFDYWSQFKDEGAYNAYLKEQDEYRKHENDPGFKDWYSSSQLKNTVDNYDDWQKLKVQDDRNAARDKATQNRDSARKNLRALEAEKAQLAGNITDDYTAAMYADRIAELDRQIDEAKKAYGTSKEEYEAAFTDYNAARNELKAADSALREAQINTTDPNYAENVKAAEERLARAKEAYIAQGGDPNANVISAGLRGSAAGVTDTVGYLQELNRPENAIKLGPITIGGGDDRIPLAARQAMEEAEKKKYEAEHGAGTWKPGYQRTQEIAGRLAAQSASEIESMKTGKGELGQFAVDMGVQGVQMAADAAAGKILPGGSLTAMALRSFGSGVREARDEGATLAQQGLYGAGTAAVEVLTEKMFDGMAGIYGAGAADDIVSHAIGRFTKNKLGQAALGMVADAAGEGLEEVVSDLANPILKSIYDEHVFDNGYFGALDGQEILYDFLVGAAMGFVGGSIETVSDMTGLKAPDARSEFFMEAGENGMSIGEAVREWQRQQLNSGYAKLTDDQSITNRANELEQSINERKFDPFREGKINRLNQRAVNQISTEDIANTVTAVEARMEELGQSDPKLAQAIAAVALEGEAERIGARGVGATKAQQDLVKSNPVAQRILSEMDVENLRNERLAGFNAFVQNRQSGATKEDYDRAVAPYQRSNEWVKTMQQNKALASDVYGAKTVVTQDEKTGKVTFTNKGGNSINGQIVGVSDGKVRIKHGKDGKYIQDVEISQIKGISAGYRQLLQAAASRKNGSVLLAQYKAGQDINSYLQAWDLAENYYGVTNLTAEKARNAFALRELTDAQLKMAMDLGRSEAKKSGTTEARQQKVTGELSFWNGGEIEGTEYDATSAEEAKKLLGDAEYSFLTDVMSKVVNVTLVKSKEVNGSFTGAQGIFFRDGRVYFDVNAGMNSAADVGQRTIVLTAAHELTHYIRAYNEDAYKALRDFVAEELVNQGKNLEDLIDQKIKRSGYAIDEDEAMEEVVADACEMMLTDAQQISAFASQHEAEARGIWKWLDKFFTRVENAFSGLTARHEEAKAMQGRITELRQMWLDALAGANANAMAREAADPTDVVTEVKTDTGFTAAVQSDTTNMMSLRTFDESGRANLDAFLNQQVQKGALTKEEAQQMRTQIEEMYKVCKEYDNGEYVPFSAWSNAEVVSIDGKPVFSVVKQNGEYKLNLDFSLVCKKRRTLDAVFNEMIRRGIMNDFRMGQGSIAKINQIIREHGFETACGLCFVDSKRYRQAMIADAFCKMYNMQVMSLLKKDAGMHLDFFNFGGDETIHNSGKGIDTLPDSALNWTKIDEILKTEKKGTVKYKIAEYLKNNPSQRKLVSRGDFMSTKGFDSLKINDQELLSLYNSKKGAGGPKAAQSDVQYLNEIIQQGQFNAKAAYAVGGIRIQSFSDYVGRLVFDYVQMVADLSAKKLPAHSYTKEFMFAQQFGLTGIKINMSLVPEVVKGGVAPGLDKDGNYTWKDGQSFGSTVYDNKGKRLTAAEGFELAKKIQNAEGYSKNCGTIAVGVSKAHIEKMLDDPEIRMIIPYHKSGLNHLVAAMEQIDKYTDYTNEQNTRAYKNGKWSKISPSEEFNWNDTLQQMQAEGKGAREAADAYLAWCREHGYKAKFDEFAGHPNYYKLLEDFSCYDKDGTTSTPLGAVQMNFPTEANAFGSMKDLIKAGLDEDAMLQAKQEGGVDDIVNEIQSVLPEWEAAHPEGKKAGQKGKSLADRKDLKFSRREIESLTDSKADRDNLGYHAGDLGKAEHLNIQGRSRGTGHFGTGTYFVGVKEKVTEDSYYGKRPQHAVDFTDYNLFKVRNDRDGYRLHDALKIIDGGINKEWIGPALEDQFNIVNPTGYYDLARSKYGEDWTRGDNLLNAMLEYAKENGIDVKSLEEYKAEEGKGIDDEDLKYYYEDYVKDTVKEEIGSINEEYREFMNAVFDLQILPGFKKAKIFSALQAVADYQNATPRNARADSYATVFMKNMGYDGVDVRGTRLDNTEYGSVIYDVKPETVRYALRDTPAVQKTKEHYNERLDKLRAEKNAKIDEIRKEETQRRQAAVKKEKAAKWEKVEETKEHYRGVMENQRKKRSDTSMRGKIKDLHKELNDILLKPKEGRYVPRELVKATAEILGAVDTTSGRAVKAKAALAELRVKYEALAKDPKYSLTYDETVSGMIQSLAEELGDGSIYDLTGYQLEGVYNTLKALKHTIVTANKLVGAKIEADAFEAANQMMRETEDAKGIPTKTLRRFVLAQMTPSSAFRMFGGYRKNSMWEQMFGELNRGQLTQTQILMEGGQIFRELIDDKKNMAKLHDRKNLVDIGLKDDQGNAIKVTRGMMLSVYMHLLNEQNARHVAYGGFTVPKLAAYYRNQMKDAYTGKTGRAVAFATEIAELNRQLETAETAQEKDEIKERLAELQDETDAYMSNLRAQIEDQLTEYDRKWISAAQEFFDDYSKGKLNEVTEMVYGFSKAQVDNYFPIHTDPDYRSASFDTITRDMSLENAGFMKERINGSNPILLEDITDVISSQLRRTAQYCGLMPAIRNFNKAYGKARAGYAMSVQSAMSRTFETEGKKYIENLMADLNGARKTEANIFDWLRGNMAGAALTLNPRVAMAQTASFPSAAAEIGYKPLAKALVDMKNPMWNKGLQEEIAKWTPLWWYRMQGYSTTELGDIKNNEQFMNKVMEKTRWLTGWIQAMDGYATGGLWQASKYYVDENFSDLERGSEEYMMKVAETFNRVLEKTQPDYTTMQRPDILRNPNAIVKQLTMFMTQRLQNTNILYDAAATYAHYVRDAAKGKNGVTSADVKQAGTRLAWAVSSQVAAGATIVIFKALADLLMHNLKAYRDDDDELTQESVRKAILTNFIETMSGNILWGSEAFSWIKSAFTGERYYGVSLNGVETFVDMLEDGNKMIQGYLKGNKDAGNAAAWKLGKAVSQFFGIPLGNAEKFVQMTKNHIEDAQNGTFMEAGVDRTRAQNTHILFDALQAGDKEKAERIRETFDDKKDEQAALKGYIRELYTEDKSLAKPDVIKLLMKYAGMTQRAAEDTAQEWTMEVVTGRKFSTLQDDYISGDISKAQAVKEYQTYSSNGHTTQDEAEAKILEWTCEKDTGIAYSDIGNEVKTGRIGKDRAVQMLIKYGGKSEDAADKQVEGWLIEHEFNIKPSELEDEYMAGNIDAETAHEILVRYKFNGKEDAEQKASDEIYKWDFIEDNPGTEDITVTQVRRYKNAGLEGVVSGKDFLDAYEATSIMHGIDTDGDGKANRNTRVDQQLAYIDGMSNLTSEQKTALALALGINERTIRNRAPWKKRR